jgi:hypothetical protein
MKDPQQALVEARRAAAAGGRGDDVDASAGAPWTLEEPSASARRLAEWAIIEPEPAQVYSTRRFGRPITLFKRLLIRLLSQYLGQMSAQQSRFNAQVAAHLIRLEERVQALEAAAPAREAPAHSTEPPPA